MKKDKKKKTLKILYTKKKNKLSALLNEMQEVVMTVKIMKRL